MDTMNDPTTWSATQKLIDQSLIGKTVTLQLDSVLGALRTGSLLLREPTQIEKDELTQRMERHNQMASAGLLGQAASTLVMVFLQNAGIVA